MVGATPRGRLVYADLLRILATLGVIVIHLTGRWVESGAPGAGAWTLFNACNGLARWCVPVFVMLSGMFLLDPQQAMSPWRLLRHLLRIVTALAFWGAAYAVFDVWLTGAFTLPAVKEALLAALRGSTHYHLWFLYMILGLYLLTPVLRGFVRGATRGELHYFLLFSFLVSILLPLLLRFRPSEAAGRYLALCYISLSAFQYAGYYVAGYYLKTFELPHLVRWILYALGVLGAVVTVGGTAFLAKAGDKSLILCEYLSPNVAATAVAVFLLFRSLPGLSAALSDGSAIGRVSQLTFGVYLVHEFFLQLLSRAGINATAFFPALAIPLLTGAIFLCSLAVAWALSRIPLLGKYLI